MDARPGMQFFPVRSVSVSAVAALLGFSFTSPALADSTGPEVPESPLDATGSFTMPEPPPGWCETQPECEVDGIDRVSHTATLLPDGRVLLIGGNVGEAPVAQTWDGGEWTFTETEWEPHGTVAMQFSPAGELVEEHGRLNHTATLLSDERVFVAGGGYLSEWGDLALASAEIWDPATETFTPVGNMAQERMWHTATSLDHDRVLIVGGRDVTGALSSAEVWDPATGAFEPAGEMADSRLWHTATLLTDGRVLVMGGRDDTGVLDSTEVWDPAIGDFGPAPSMMQARAGHTASPLSDDRILVVGGVGNGSDDQADGWTAVASAEVWDPASGGFEIDDTGPMDLARAFHTATSLEDGHVIVIGGLGQVHPGRMESPEWFEGGWEYSTAESWDPATGTFNSAGTFEGPRFRHTATPLSDGRVIVLGGGLAQPQIWVPSES